MVPVVPVSPGIQGVREAGTKVLFNFLISCVSCYNRNCADTGPGCGNGCSRDVGLNLVPLGVQAKVESEFSKMIEGIVKGEA